MTDDRLEQVRLNRFLSLDIIQRGQGQCQFGLNID